MAEWIDSPEAYFATSLERTEWTHMTSDAERAKFVERYWLRRDPTPGTAQNEFRDQIEQRIMVADQKFPFEKTRGAATARGMIWVVFGPPARFRTSTAAPPDTPRASQPATTLSEGVEIGESYETWIYDRQRTPHLLEMVTLPSLQFDFVIRPQKHIDELQSPGLASELRAKLAERSVVNANAGIEKAPSIAPVRLDATLTADATRALDDAPPPEFGSAGGYFASSTRWSSRGEPVVAVWFAATKPQSEGSMLIGRVRRADGSVAGSIYEVLRSAPGLRASSGGPVYAVQLPLAAGDYNATFAVVDASGETIASAALPLHVPDAANFGASSILLSSTPQAATGGSYDIGKIGITPRADLTFSRSESLWYSGEVANPSDPKTVAIEVRMRSGAKVIGADHVALEAEPSGPHRYFFAREIPLASFEPGDYTLYFVIRDASGGSEIRRADFRIVP